MKSYNLFERTVAKTLDNFPQLRQTLKFAYQRFNYWYYGDRNFELALHPQVKLLTPQSWCGLPSETAELFFGYYDKSPWSFDLNCIIAHRLVDRDIADILVFDRQTKTAKVVGSSSTWTLQQGSMTQWLPSRDRTLIFNDLIDDRLSAKIVTADGELIGTIPVPIQTLHPNGKEALSLNYKRLYRLKPEYGYSVAASNFSSDLPLSEDGIWSVDLETKETKLLIDLASLSAYQPRAEMRDSEHKVNHIMYSPQGTKFVFMHRWLGSQGKFSRLYVADRDGNSLKLLLDDRLISHYSWQDESHLLTWARTSENGDRYYLINVNTGAKQIIGAGVLDTYGDGHPSFSPDKRWILTDTYPDKARQQHLLLYNLEKKELIELGRFLEPWQYYGANRCDLHPRWSRDGNFVSFDSTHTGKRMTYILDVSAVVSEAEGAEGEKLKPET